MNAYRGVGVNGKTEDRRFVALACGHNPDLAIIARGAETAWCFVCEQYVEFRSGATGTPQKGEGIR